MCVCTWLADHGPRTAHTHKRNHKKNKTHTNTYPQRAAYLKEEGNKAFKAQDMARAEGRYSEAIGVLQVR